MRILHLNQYGTRAGGTEAYIADVSLALAAAGHQTRLVSFAPEPLPELAPGTVQVASADPKATLATIEAVIADFRPDAAYLHAVYEPRVVRWISGRLPTIPYLHGPYLVCPGRALFLRRSSRACRRTAGPWCLVNAQIERCCFGRNPVRHVRRLRQARSLLEATSRLNTLVGSEFMRRKLVANGLPAQGLTVLAPFLVDERLPEYTPATDPTVILFAGRLVAEKGLRHLIQALKPVRTSWQLVVAGDGPDREACEQLADRLGIAPRIEFVGWVGPQQMGALYHHCAFVVVPSLMPEPYGRTGPEAFLHGRPAVAYAVGGIPEWLEDGETGYLAIPGDVGSLSGAVARLLESRDDQERMGRVARQRAQVRWNAGTHVQTLAACFESAIRCFEHSAAPR